MWLDRDKTIVDGYIGVFKIVERVVRKESRSNNVVWASCPTCSKIARFSHEFSFRKKCLGCGTPVIDRSVGDMKPPEGKFWLYYIKLSFDGKDYYKIGYTKKHIYDRFSAVYYSEVTLLGKWVYDAEDAVRAAEKTILKLFHCYKLPKGVIILKNNGNTEIFTTDVLRLDK